VLDAFWRLGRCPVLIVEDTDHWGGERELADAFFDHTARALGRLDAVTIVQAQTTYTELDGYRCIRETFTAELHLPAPPDPRAALITILQRRISCATTTRRRSRTDVPATYGTRWSSRAPPSNSPSKTTSPRR
jgi:hypothetical protein